MITVRVETFGIEKNRTLGRTERENNTASLKNRKEGATRFLFSKFTEPVS